MIFKWVFLWGLVFGDLLVAEKKQDIRDPFNLPVKSNLKKNLKIKLLGIVCSANRYGAILQVDGTVNTFFLNDKFNGVALLKIASNYVVVSYGKNKKQLFLK